MSWRGLSLAAVLLAFTLTACDESKSQRPVDWLNRYYKKLKLPDGWDIDSVSSERTGLVVEVDLPQQEATTDRSALAKRLAHVCPAKSQKVWNFLKPNQGITVRGNGSWLSQPVKYYCPGPV